MNGTANQPLLEVRGLCKSFGDLEVLKSIDQNIYKGEKVAVIGPSGSGKSTFLRCLNCMEDPTGGSIFFGGEDLADMKVPWKCSILRGWWSWYRPNRRRY